ncbi:hypothetical protein TraAM80_03893 [Trypanosoma rangeli]|uniref:Arf3-interacting protein 1 N-terminal domain-containing protein n=1 Tax=Trypanosoma rangeli TaxID=5698 RepID=A0A3R7NR38_TRYRA|nr:uncharacterized protein TraAM80_03893 [Trypanosoma rangeli]RNF06426.1 hypothetical protein TraAM80_03893 [Trypanosoma rangeli]|eukprot:RNF06426.1 hypothetical protein TraAM80_03893 [Trypanosoma rangeli]
MEEIRVNDTGLPIAYYVLLAEFDVDTGPCLRAKYPSALSRAKESADGEGNMLCGMVNKRRDETVKQSHSLELDEDYCASHMLPDGGEKQVISRTIFIANRTRPVNTHRFPVCCFTLTAPARPRDSETGSLSFSKEWEWVRDAAAEDVLLHEELNYNRAAGNVCVLSKGAVMWGPVTVQAPDAFQVCPTLPTSVVAFVQQLRKRFGLRSADVARGRKSHKNDTKTFFDIPLMSSTAITDYSFLVHHSDSVYRGFLMKSTHLEVLMRSKKMPQSSPGAGVIIANAVKEEPAIELLNGTESSTVPPLYGLCAVVTRKDLSVRRGGISKSVALLGPKLVWLECFFPLLVETALQCCDIKGKTEEAFEQQTALVRRCFEAVDAATCSLRHAIREVPGTSLEHEVMRLFNMSGRQAHVLCALSPFGSSHKLRIPLFPQMYDFDFSSYGLEQMVEVCGASFWTLVVAVLLEKRVVVLSRQGLPNDVCEAALSLGLIGNLLDPHFLTTKVFPYTSVNGFSHFSHVPGYIIGTVNPIFETQHAWWDALCDLDNKCVVLSSEGNSSVTSLHYGSGSGNASGKAGDWATQDARVSKYILDRLARMKAMRKSSCERHQAVLLMIEEYLVMTIMVSEVDHSILSRIVQTVFCTPTLDRLRALAQGSAIFHGALEHFLLPGEDPLLIIAVATVRRANRCDRVELMRALAHLLNRVRSYNDVICLLRRMPLALEGLNPIALQLLHTSPPVCQAALELMRRVELFPPGKIAIAAMNEFSRMKYKAASQDVLH